MSLGPLFVALLAVGVSACGPSAADMFPLGGAWHMYLHQGYMIEAGGRPSDIYREWNGRRVLVASDVEFHQYYAGPDCLLWETKTRNHVVFAACADRQPMIIVQDDYHRWTMKPGRLVDEDDARTSGQGAAVKATAWFPVEDIAVASARQPMFSGAWTPLMARVDEDLVPVEADVPIDVSTPINGLGRTPLMEAAWARDTAPGSRLALVNALIAQGANVNGADNFGYTALMVAADRGHADVVKRLIEAGADVHARREDGRTALMEAAGSTENQVECVTLLLMAGADKTARDKYGNTAFSGIRQNPDPRLPLLLALER